MSLAVAVVTRAHQLGQEGGTAGLFLLRPEPDVSCRGGFLSDLVCGLCTKHSLCFSRPLWLSQPASFSRTLLDIHPTSCSVGLGWARGVRELGQASSVLSPYSFWLARKIEGAPPGFAFSFENVSFEPVFCVRPRGLVGFSVQEG